jgi:hypothetical protein
VKISAIDRQDLLDLRIGVGDGEDDRVDVRERLINVLRQDISGSTPTRGGGRLD